MDKAEFKQIMITATVAADAQFRRLGIYQVDRARNRVAVSTEKLDEINFSYDDATPLLAILLGFSGYNKELTVNDIEELIDRCDRLNRLMRIDNGDEHRRT